LNNFPPKYIKFSSQYVSVPGRCNNVMLQRPITTAPLSASPGSRKFQRGASILELVIVMAVASIMAAIAVPLVSNLQRTMRLNAAVSAVAGTMQSTRYRAIYDGCPYAVAFSKATNTSQISSEVTGGACAAALTNVGTAVPFADPRRISLDQDVTFQFSPGGSVTVTNGTNSFNLNAIGTTNPKNIKVTKYGSITVQ